MARPLRIEFTGAIYHVMARGNARQQIARDHRDYERLRSGLAHTIERYGWELFSFVFMPNHLHLFFRTPKPNLSGGMQYYLSGYANWFSKRHQRPGHLFQGRFRGELIENESYFWNVSRYTHLNPVRGERPLVTHPRDWPWSSYPGYANRKQRLCWVAYDLLLAAWQGEMGGANAAPAYRRFVEKGLRERVENPFREAADGWLLGSQEFVDRMRRQMPSPRYRDQVPLARRLACLPLAAILDAVAEHFGVAQDVFSECHTRTDSRDIAAWLARRHTTLTLRELAGPFGLSHPDSVSNLVRRVDRVLEKQPGQLQRDIAAIRKQLLETGNRV
jgi:putative transposase